MQLRSYLAVVQRYWVVIGILPLLVGAISLVLALREPQYYRATARAMVTQTVYVQAQTGAFPDFNLNYSWASSEYILDDVPQLVQSRVFAEDVSALAAAEGYSIDPALVMATLNAETLHRTMTLSARTADPALAVALVRGAVTALQANGLKYWDRALPDDPDPGLKVAVLDMPTSAAPTRSMRQLLFDVGLRVMLALVAGIGLAFLLHYLDDRLRDAYQVEEWLDVQVIGVIPRDT